MKLLLKRFFQQNFFLILIIVFAVLLRFLKLSEIPIGFNDDEAAFGYNAYSIFKTGRDEWGKLLPFPVFESFGDWKLVVYLYLTVISQFIFGLNEFATRFPSAAIGVLAVFATYLLSKELFDKKVALISAFFLSISPWHIIASRNAFESDLLVFFITISTYFFLKGLKNKLFFSLSLLGFAISFYVYRSSWIFLPLFISTLFYLYRRELEIPKSFLVKNILVFVILLFPLLPTVLTFKGQSRFLQESFIAGIQRTGITNNINEARGICNNKFPDFICQLTYNKFFAFSKIYINNYFGNLAIKAYFDNANPTGFQSYMTRSVLYLFELPLIMLGLIFLFKSNSPSKKVLLPWILFFPAGAAIAGVGNYGRLNLFMPVPQILAAFGFIATIAYIKNQAVKIGFIFITSLIIFISASSLISDIFFVEPYYTSRYQRYGYKQLFTFLNSKEHEYDKIIISRKIDYGHQYMQYLYFSKLDPKFFQSNVKRHKSDDGWIVFNSIGKYNFVDSAPGFDSLPPKSMIIVGELERNLPGKLIYSINYLNGDIGFDVFDVRNITEKTKREEE